MLREGYITKVLILCKKSIKKQWVREIDKFTTLKDEMASISFIPESATKKKRDTMYAEFGVLPSGVLVTTYESCMHDSDKIQDIGFDMCIIDEVHTIKAPKGVKNTAVKYSIKAVPYKVLLTGTPVTNKPIDLYGIVGLCTPNHFNMKISAFKKRYVTYWNNGRFISDVGFKNIEELRDRCQSIMLRRTENEVTLELPTVINKDVHCTMDKLQDQLTKQIMALFRENNDRIDEIKADPKLAKNDKELDGLEAKKRGILGLRQVVANDPSIFRYGKSMLVHKLIDTNKSFPKYKGSDKTVVLKELVEDIINAGEKVIIFSKFERTVRYLCDRLEKLSCNVVTYTGALNEETRNDNIDAFVDDIDTRVLIATNAGAEGLNAQVANHVIHFDLPDTVAIGIQRMGRARRAGSTYKNVFVYNMITESSVDETVKKKLEKQQKLFSSVVELDENESAAIKKLSN